MPSYNKLVRDKIPAIIEGKGQKPVTHILDKEAYKEALLRKLHEEADECSTAQTTTELAEELADVLEVVRALGTAIGIAPDELERLRAAKETERGGFEQRIFLEGVEE